MTWFWQMGSTMKPVIFNERVASALKSWYQTAKKNKGGRRSENTTPFSSRPATPLHGTSPLHLLHAYQNNADQDSLQASPRASHFDYEGLGAADGSLPASTHNNNNDDESKKRGKKPTTEQQSQDPTTSRMLSPRGRQQQRPDEHEINISLRDFSFIERG